MFFMGRFALEALVSPVFDTQIVGKYTERAWTIFTTMSLILAVATRTSNSDAVVTWRLNECCVKIRRVQEPK